MSKYVNITNKTMGKLYIYGFVQGCSISIANALDILQSYTKPSICQQKKYMAIESQTCHKKMRNPQNTQRKCISKVDSSICKIVSYSISRVYEFIFDPRTDVLRKFLKQKCFEPGDLNPQPFDSYRMLSHLPNISYPTFSNTESGGINIFVFKVNIYIYIYIYIRMIIQWNFIYGYTFAYIYVYTSA